MLVLGVEVVGACDLKPWDKNSYLSTYVVLTFDGQQFQTTTKENDLNPVWNEHFYFKVSNPTYLPKLFLEASVRFVTRKISSRNMDSAVRIDGTSFVPLTDSVVKGSTSIRPSRNMGRAVRIDGTSFVLLTDSVVKGYNIKSPLSTSIRPTGEVLRMKVYVTDEASIRASHPLLGMVWVICSLDFHVSNNHERKPGDLSSRPYFVPLQCLKDITNNFSDKRIIGKGGFSAVYKGVLENGEMIAVKKIEPQRITESQRVEVQFQKEVCHLMTVKHPNIVQCVGYCYETLKEVAPYNEKMVFVENTEMLLCLEYLPTGSLNEYLSDESSGLNWSTRYKIIEGICYGLCHLHGQKDNPIIHLDLKPRNILLGDGMIPKIADFGLSRLLEQQHTIYTSSHDGTSGYMAPEFFVESGALSTKSDIFSLGVIIIEIITGCRKYPSDVTEPSSSNEFVEMVLCNWKNRLRRSRRYGALDIDCEEELKRCIQIGLMCLNPDRKQRPPIWNIINMLQGTESIVRGISNHATSSAGQACTGTDHLSGVDVAARPLTSWSIRPHPRS